MDYIRGECDMSESSVNWTWVGAFFTGSMALIAGFKWLFSRPSDHAVRKLYSECMKRFDDLAERLGKLETPLALMDERIKRAELDILDLRKWKHEKGDPYIGAVDVLKARIDGLEVRRKFE
jgi:hypothetical protein